MADVLSAEVDEPVESQEQERTPDADTGLVLEDVLLVEDVSIDGMCGVY